jgi:hypothetical protein
LLFKNEYIDLAACFHSYSWPRQAEHFLYRHRPGQWPPDILIDDIVNYGCLLVPIGPKEIENNELLWRISFSMNFLDNFEISFAAEMR